MSKGVFKNLHAPNARRHLLQCLTLLGITASATGQAAIVETSFESLSSGAQSSVPVTFGQVFTVGDVPAGATLRATLPGGASVPLQVDKKATHADGTLRHAVLTTVLPTLPGGGSTSIAIDTGGSAPPGAGVQLGGVLATSFNTTVTLLIGNTTYSADARSLLQGASPAAWLSGPLVTEWMVAGPVKTAGGTAHPHLTVRFNVRAYAGVERARVSVIVENTSARVAGPRNYSYLATVQIPGQGTVLMQNNVNHYRQARWRRAFWWGSEPAVHIKHDPAYLMRTGAVPTFDGTVPESALRATESEWSGSTTELMSPGLIHPDMPAPGGRPDIGPLPRWSVRYLLSQDERAKRVMLGNDEQAGSFGVHYRDRATDLPISLDDYPNMTIVDSNQWFPACGGNCSTPLDPETSHEPSLAYLPYMVTGDHFFLEELLFWANWNLYYGQAGRHGFAQGLVVWDQIRGQAWSLRTLGDAAFITPDSHPMKSYFLEKLANNIDYYNQNWLNSNPLGYVTNTGANDWLDLQRWISTWMDDFLTWTFGHLVALGFTDATAMRDWKAKFPVGRLTHPDMCWILASTSWPTVMDNVYLGGSGVPVDTWDEWRRNVIFSWDSDAFRPSSVQAGMAGNEQRLINAACNSPTMASILNLGVGDMIGYTGPDGYPANLQPAAAVAVEAGIPNADAAWSTLRGAANYPNFNEGDPQWGIVPGTVNVPGPGVLQAPSSFRVQ